MEIRIQALDTLFFRDGKPFEKRQETWADGNLIPSPSVVYGALRTAFATANGITYKEVAEGNALKQDEFQIKNIFYQVEGKNLLPLPLDLLQYEKDAHIKIAEEAAKRYELRPLQLRQHESEVVSRKNKSTEYLLLPRQMDGKEQISRVEELENGMIELGDLTNYLSGDMERIEAYKLDDYVLAEPKVGIAREDSTKVVEEGSLFRVDMRRSDTFQIRVSLQNNSGHTQFAELIKMGGETKVVHLSQPLRPARMLNQAIDFPQHCFKIYCATPAIFDAGKPDLSWLGIKPDEVQFISSRVGKALHIGGFDMYRKRPKTMHRVVPAGSVFYYQAQKEVSFLNEKQGVSLSDHLQEQGFGICYFGNWNVNL